ncbi:uncharacterized protein LOC135955336 [Calliphora vicina]|uniref:uncharacterized protein LOC135955336 n=1 Tax=Calliphora vicina TaxID=7373 RepID=UPI00325BC5D5
MRVIFLCAFVTLAAASRNHQIIVLKSENPTTEYREEDSKGFYSYGYSSDDSAKAEYKTRDGSSKGFYSYIDTEGKLQTVKYEAGRRQGFTASATNLPTPPMDNNRAPEPVQDTPEVEMAKQAHFEAYREAAIKAAMQPDTGDNGSDAEDDANEAANASQAAQQESDLQQNTRELLMNRQNSREQLLQLLREQQQLQQQQQQQQQLISQHPQLMTTYVLNAEARVEQPTLSELKTIYRLDSSDSKVELKLGGLDLDNSQQRSLDLLQQTAHVPQLSAEESLGLGSFESIRVPSNSYYTVTNPDTHYTVETPTVLTTLPRLVSISLGNHRLPISLSTAFSSQRLGGKSSTHYYLIAGILADSYLYPVPLQQLQTPLLVVKTQQQPGLQSQQQQQRQQIQQYFSQDSLGQYSYGYSEPLSTKQEIRTLDGVTSGSYSYIDANDLLQTVDYTADDKGFHVVATNLPKDTQEAPKPVQETAEVAAAREQHLAAHKAILEGNLSASFILPKPVEDTTEVAQAKKEFFALYSAEQEKQKLLQKAALLRNKEIIVSNPVNAVQPTLTVFKSKPAVVAHNFPSSKIYFPTRVGGFTYGYQIGGAIKPTRYYLPLA